MIANEWWVESAKGGLVRVALLLLLSLLVVPISVVAQEADTGQYRVSKIAHAHRIEGTLPSIDGRLDDDVWGLTRPITDFLQKDPTEFGEPSSATAVHIAYDDTYLYIGARMAMTDPEDVSRVVTRRDRSGATDRIILSFDSYKDERTAYSFSVTAAGVRTDYVHTGDSEHHRDYSFDPIWMARTEVGESEWTAEVRIPFSQLRFNEGEDQVWGLNINRYKPGRKEDIYWIVVPRDAVGWSSKMGELRGVRGVEPSARIELLPYVAADLRLRDNVDPDDPYEESPDFGARAGLDLKLGLGPNLTLDATINPDFGQVEADPSEVNLSAFETFFSERRPFFVEGANLFSYGGPRHFYSRRIGASPRGRLDGTGDYVDVPDASTILGAAKLTGRLSSGTSIGGIVALTEREEARLYTSVGEREERVTIEPMTFYGVGRVRQEFGDAGSNVGAITTLVVRDLPEGVDLRLPSNAVTGGLDWNLELAERDYTFRGHAAFSHVAGDSLTIAQIQRNATHYFARPDATHVTFDPTATAIDGWSGSMKFQRNEGAWRYEVGAWAESPGYDLNNIGSLRSADDIDLSGELSYRNQTPGSTFRSWQVEADARADWNFGGLHRSTTGSIDLNVTWKNWLYNYAGFGTTQAHMSDTKTRGGPLMKVPSTLVNAWVGMGNNFGSQTRWSWHCGASLYELDGYELNVNGDIATNIGDRLELSIGPGFYIKREPRQFVTALDGGPSATFDRRYVFSRLDFARISAEIRGSYAITPDLVVELYVEPFAASGEYAAFGELAEAATDRFTSYGNPGDPNGDQTLHRFEVGGAPVSIDNPDFSTRSFTSNLVLRWELLPGSTFFAVWQMNRGAFDPGRQSVAVDDWIDALGDDGEQIFALKFSYWLPID